MSTSAQWEALIKAGVFDSLNPNRAALLGSVEKAFGFAAATAANANQGGLFDMFDDGDNHGSSAGARSGRGGPGASRSASPTRKPPSVLPGPPV